MRRTAVLGAVLLSLCAPLPALAGDTDDADALIKQGLLLRRQGKDTEALAEFLRAYALHPSPRGRAQIALAEQALGRWLQAEEHLAEALRAADDAWIATNRGSLESGLANIRTRLGWLEVTADVPGAELWVNDVRVGTLPLGRPIRLEAGSAVVEVRAEGHAPARRITAIEPGGSAREAVHLVPLGESPPPEASEATPVPVFRTRVVPGHPAMRNVGLVATGAGLLGLAAGAYFGVVTLQKKADRDVNSKCNADVCNWAGLMLDEEARTAALRSTAWIGAGIVSLGTGVALLWVSRSHAIRERVGAVRLVPELGPDRAGVSLGGSW